MMTGTKAIEVDVAASAAMMMRCSTGSNNPTDGDH